MVGVFDQMPIKFFSRDVIRGSASREGEVFVALWFGEEREFKVESLHGESIFATLEPEQ